MRLNFAIFIIILIGSTSCKSLQGLPAKDTSSHSTDVKIDRFSSQPIFMEDIAISPGEGSKEVRQTIVENNNNSKLATGYANKASASVGIENAVWLQFKYAIMTGIAVEELSNLKLLQSIEDWYGTRYCMGGTTERCIDCSAFTLTLMKDAYDLSLPRIAQDQYYATSRVSLFDLQQGDLVFFHTTGRYVSHVGLYIGNNKFVHASTSKGVMISDLNDNYWSGRYVGAGRVKKTLEDNSFDGLH